MIKGNNEMKLDKLKEKNEKKKKCKSTIAK